MKVFCRQKVSPLISPEHLAYFLSIHLWRALKSSCFFGDHGAVVAKRPPELLTLTIYKGRQKGPGRLILINEMIREGRAVKCTSGVQVPPCYWQARSQMDKRRHLLRLFFWPIRSSWLRAFEFCNQNYCRHRPGSC